MAGLRNRKFLLIVVSSIAALAIVVGAVLSVNAINRSKSTESMAAATTDCGSNHGGARVETDGGCAECVDGAANTASTSDDGGEQAAAAVTAVDCRFYDNGICTKTGEECTNCINADIVADAVNTDAVSNDGDGGEKLSPETSTADGCSSCDDGECTRKRVRERTGE